jgi:hypothetical protein
VSDDTSSFVLPAAEIRRCLARASPGDVVLIAQQCLRVGSHAYAAAICRAFRDAGMQDSGLCLTEAAALFGAGRQEAALELVDSVLRDHPEHSGAAFYKAQMLVERRQAGPARELLLGVIGAFPDFPGAQGALATLFMPGPYYRDVLARIHRLLRPRTYLEIGVETGATLALAAAARIAVGVDPDPRPLRREIVPRNGRIFEQESAAFFASRQRDDVFEGLPVDLTFIDGMHLYEYALADFVGAERWSGPDSTILLHDCVPLVPLTAERERRSKFWVGDLWKLLPILREYRPALRISIVPCAPSGLVVVRGLDPSSRTLSENLDEIQERYRNLAYSQGPLEWPSGVTIVENSEAGLTRALA